MNILPKKPLGRQIAYYVLIGLLSFSIITGLFTYTFVFKFERNQISSFEDQLIFGELSRQEAEEIFGDINYLVFLSLQV